MGSILPKIDSGLVKATEKIISSQIENRIALNATMCLV